jgi:predicted RNase H-like HicB family nuclease
MTFSVEMQQEDDGRWIAEVLELPGVMAYGVTPEEAKAKVQVLALRVLAERLEHGEAGYRQMAEDEAREAEAIEWVEATLWMKSTPTAPKPAGTASSSPG